MNEKIYIPNFLTNLYPGHSSTAPHFFLFANCKNLQKTQLKPCHNFPNDSHQNSSYSFSCKFHHTGIHKLSLF